MTSHDQVMTLGSRLHYDIMIKVVCYDTRIKVIISHQDQGYNMTSQDQGNKL